MRALRTARVDWRDPLRMTVAAAVAFALSSAAHLPEGYWSVLTALIVTRPHFGATMSAAAGRLAGTLCGAALAVAVATLRLWHVPEFVRLVATVAPLGALVAWRSDYRTAPVAAVIVLSAGSGESSALAAALLRVVEVALGAAVGAAASWLLFRTDAAQRAERLAPRLLRRLGEILALGAGGASGVERLDGLIETSRAEIRALALIARTASWDRRGASRAETLAKLMARLHADIAFIVRAARAAPGDGKVWLGAAAAGLQERAVWIAAAVESDVAPSWGQPMAMPPDEASEPAVALRFLLQTLARDLDALAVFLGPVERPG